MTAYYNEIDPFAAAWLRELIKQGHIAPGDVDERSIEDVAPNELAGYTQCHFFAGIGVWSYALRQAGISDSTEVWTGSCPCQPFSAAGKKGGFDDERHLWPTWQWLIQQQRPAIVIGEQVASKATGPWFDLVQADLEAMGYAFGCVPFPSAAVGAPHIRDRAYWLVVSGEQGLEGFRGGHSAQEGHGQNALRPVAEASESVRLADSDGPGCKQRREATATLGHGGASGAACCIDRDKDAGPTNGLWADADWLYCRDGKWRPVEPGTFPLADGPPARVGRLRGYGNAINAEAARAFIESIF